MARTFEEVIRDGINRSLFIKEMEAVAHRRKPVRTNVQPTGTLFAIRNKRIAIREAALRLVQIVIAYTKTTTKETRRYVVAPYEMKYRRLRAGRRKMLWAYDMNDRHIKSFVLNNVRNVSLTDRKFVPKWPVKIKIEILLPALLSLLVLWG
jgi:predicted DNA-binding transcriptional regulator YafY